MESLGILKYWRGNGGAAAALSSATTVSSVQKITTISATADDDLSPADEVDNGVSTPSDEGPFFDLEFAMPGDVDVEAVDSGSDNEDDMAELDLVGASDGLQPECLSLSPSNEIFFKGKLVAVETSSAVVLSDGESNKPQLAAALLKSATKFRVFLLRLKKPKSSAATATAVENDGINEPPPPSTPKQLQLQQSNNKKLLVKFKFEEMPLVSLFTRDNSNTSRISSTGGLRLQPDEPTAAEKKLAKELMQKYINKIKPLYIKVSKRYAEKLRISALLNVQEKETATESAKSPQTASVAAAAATATSVLPAVVRKKLGKSKSASSTVAAAPPPPPPPPRRRDDTLLQQEDGIQSAIAHCKRSFNTAKGAESPLMRSMNDAVRPMSAGADDGQD